MEPEKIIFMLGIKILNKGPHLNKKIREIFKHYMKIKIRVIDANSIICAGGPITESFIIFNEYQSYFISLHKK